MHDYVLATRSNLSALCGSVSVCHFMLYKITVARFAAALRAFPWLSAGLLCNILPRGGILAPVWVGGLPPHPAIKEKRVSGFATGSPLWVGSCFPTPPPLWVVCRVLRRGRSGWGSVSLPHHCRSDGARGSLKRRPLAAAVPSERRTFLSKSINNMG